MIMIEYKKAFNIALILQFMGVLTLSRYIEDRDLPIKVRKYEISKYLGSGKPEHLFRANGLDIESLVSDIKKSRI